MSPPRPTQLAQIFLRDAIREGDTVIDATAGNGHDTVFLAGCVGLAGKVLAFDVQPPAIENARRNVAAAGFASRVEFHQISHARMAEYAGTESVTAVMFNLGYLPGENHEFTTHTAETLAAIAAATELLKPGGLLSVVCYPGHPAGATEAMRVEEWMNTQPGKGWKAAKYAMLGTLKPAPFLIVGRKL